VPLGAPAHQRHGVGHRRLQVEARDVELHAPGLDLRQVEDVVDEREQVLAGVADVADELLLLLGMVPAMPPSITRRTR
jgi:hypothetical protein